MRLISGHSLAALPERYRVVCELAPYIPLEILFDMPYMAGADFEREPDGRVRMVWASRGAGSYTLPGDVWQRFFDYHLHDGNRRCDVPFTEQRVLTDDDGKPMTRAVWFAAIADAVKVSAPGHG